MKFTVPEGYSVVFQGQLIQSKGGVIETDDKALIDRLSQNPRAKAEKQAAKPAQKPDEGA